MKIPILIDMPLIPGVVDALANDPRFECRFPEKVSDEARELPEDLIADCEIFFGTELPLNHAVMRKLKLVQISSVGYSQLYGHNLAERNIRCCNAIGVQDRPIAEWNLCMMIALRRDLMRMRDNQQHAIWDRDPVFQQEISGLTLGIWGYGGIGRETARLAKCLGMKIHVLTRDGTIKKRRNCYCVPGSGDESGILPDRVFSLRDRLEFLSGIDFLVLAIPLTPENTGILGPAELAALPRHAYILNPARGPLIQEEALIRALKQNAIAGAALDTHYRYPLEPEHPFWKMPQVILTPHISGSSQSSHFLSRIWDVFLQNVRRFTSGQALLNELSEHQLNGH